jgi:hypothetical protein
LWRESVVVESDYGGKRDGDEAFGNVHRDAIDDTDDYSSFLYSTYDGHGHSRDEAHSPACLLNCNLS